MCEQVVGRALRRQSYEIVSAWDTLGLELFQLVRGFRPVVAASSHVEAALARAAADLQITDVLTCRAAEKGSSSTNLHSAEGSLMRRIVFAGILALAATSANAADYWPKGAKVYFISPQNGESFTGKVPVKFGLSGLGVAPAGMEKAGTGHHHVLIDTPAPSGDELKAPLPADDQHRHFGGGQTETILDLKPGRHTLQLIVGDMNHIPHEPPLMSEKISITVK